MPEPKLWMIQPPSIVKSCKVCEKWQNTKHMYGNKMYNVQKILRSGGRSFKDTKTPTKEVNCCDAWIAERTDRWTKTWVRLWISFSLSLSLLMFPLSQSLSVFVYLSACLPACPSPWLSVSISLSLSLWLFHYFSQPTHPMYTSIWNSETGHFCEASSKSGRAQLQKEALRWECRKVKIIVPKRRNYARLPPCWNCRKSETKQFCETSFKNGKLSAERTPLYQCVLRCFSLPSV